MKITLKPNEIILRAGDSNLMLEQKIISGKLIVTNQRIYFKSLHEKFSENDKEILPKEISELHFFKTRGLFPNGLKIITKDGDSNRFKVGNRSEWARLITRMY